MRHLFQQAQPKVSPAPWLMMVIMFVALQFYFGVDRFYNGQYFYGIAIIMLLLWLYTTKRIPAMINTYSEFIGQRSLWIFLTHFTWLQGLLHFLLAQSVTLTIASTVIFIVCGLVGSAVLGICFHYLQSYITSHIMRYRN
jgi:hypothetical protein